MSLEAWMEKAMIADDGKPGKSLKETSTEELKATLAKLKPTDPGAEGRISAIKGELKSRGEGGKMEKAKQPSESTSLTPQKARLMLHEGSGGHGRPITEQQRKFFGAVGGHLPAPGDKAKKSMDGDEPEEGEKLEKFVGKLFGGGKGGEGSRGGKIVGHDAHGKPIYERKAGSIAMTGGGKHVTAAKHHDKESIKNRTASDAFRGKHEDWESHDHHDAAHAHEKMAEATKDKKLKKQHQAIAHVHRQVATGKEHDERKAGGKRRGAKVASKQQKQQSSESWEEHNKSIPPATDLDDWMEKAKRGGTAVGSKTKGGYTVKMVGGKKRYVKEKAAEKKPAAAAAAGPMTAEAASKLVKESVMKTGDGKSHRFSDDPAKAQKVLDGLPSGTRVTRYDDTGYADTSMVKQGNKWITEDADSPQDDWDVDPDEGYETKHEFNSAEMGKIVSRGWNDAHIFLPKTGSAATGAPATTAAAAAAAPGAAEGTGVSAQGGKLPEPKVSKIGNATIRDYGDIGLIRSQPGLGHTVLDAEGTEVGEIGEHKSLKAAEQKLMSMRKSMERPMSLEDWMEKSGGLPTHQQDMGHKKSSAVEGGSADGGELADTGRTSGSSDSAPGPEQDSQGQLKGVSPGGKQKLSEDDAEESKQMTPHKKPIETIKKSAFPADQRDTMAQERAAAVSRLQKSEDVYVGPNQHPYSEHATHASGDADASELVKSETFYHGNSPQVAPGRPIIEQGVLCKSVNMAGCGATYNAALTSCPDCGAGTVGHRHVPGGPVVGAEMTILEKSIGPGSLLQRPPQEPDVKIG
jgi:hypothetical protein